VFKAVFHNRDDHAQDFSSRMDHACPRKRAPCHDLSHCERPGGAQQMDVEGEGRDTGRAHPMRLAASNGLDAAWAAAAVDHGAAVGGEFRADCKDYALRPATRQKRARMIEANRTRMV
jgi:serine/threonine-protein kinase HipA